MLKEVIKPIFSPIVKTETAKRIKEKLEKSERIQKLGLYYYYSKFRFSRDLSPQGRRILYSFYEGVKNGLPLTLSDCKYILKGYRFENQSVGLLKDLEKTGALIIGNHSGKAPLMGYSQTVALASAISNATGKDIRMVHGRDKSTFADFAILKIQKSFNTIVVKEKDKGGARDILKALKDKSIVGIYPEGHGGSSLKRAIPESGMLILLAAKLNIPIVCAATYLENKTFKVTFLKLPSEPIQHIGQNYKPKMPKEESFKIGQEIADFAMLQIASMLPIDKRGYYSELLPRKAA